MQIRTAKTQRKHLPHVPMQTVMKQLCLSREAARRFLLMDGPKDADQIPLTLGPLQLYPASLSQRQYLHSRRPLVVIQVRLSQGTLRYWSSVHQTSRISCSMF